MAVPLAGMITAVTFLGRANEQRIMNTVHYRMTSGFTNSTIALYSQEMFNLIKPLGLWDVTSAYLAVHAGDWTLEQIRVQVIYPLRYRAFVGEINASGTRPGTADAQNAGMTITKIVEEAGRSKVGSIHLGGVATNDFSQGRFVPLFLPLVTVLRTKLMQVVFEDSGPGVNTPVLYHPGSNVIPKFDILTALVAQTTVRTQRTRTIGKGE